MRRFTVSDLPTLDFWLAGHDLPPKHIRELGSIGYIVDGVACGFLLLTDAPGFAIIDGICTNPAASGRARYLAVLDIMLQLMTESVERGVQSVGGFTTSTGMGKVAARAGLERVGVMSVYRRKVG